MNTILVITTIAILAVLILAIIKKFDITLSLLALSTLGFIIYTIVTGESVMGEETCGSHFLDVFMLLEQIFKAQIADNVLLLMAVFAYISYLNHIKATDLLCLMLCKPLSKVRSKYLVLCGVMIITIFLKFVIFSNSGQMAVVLATMYPILVALGISRETAASGITFATGIAWGPANGMTALLFSMGDVGGMTIPEYFLKYEIPNITVSVLFALVVFYFSSKYFDKKEGVQIAPPQDVTIDPHSLGLPLWYSVLPFLPVIMVVIFSSLVVKTITISIIAASLFSFLLVAVLEIIRLKGDKKAIEDTKEFWIGCGSMMSTLGCLIIAAGVFGKCIGQLAD